VGAQGVEHGPGKQELIKRMIDKDSGKGRKKI
jgi:hypothetical protein